ncbi:ABC transporter ATP-binding protein [Uliginosibacterium sp. H3]|uniref:ABC transporter ATP-binding protein n=1 Tax=Uliginosibacterium silvisoli TaxID=3114758 RepID=A0ABU6K674_9RHOO|nr:ABC transporter ATP-binding protein [Uliginosibacterium sp. H3]
MLKVSNLSVSIDSEQGEVRPLAKVSFEVRKGETFVLLGESGCGKSMTTLALMRLLPDGGRITQGSVQLDGEELLALTEAQMQGVRGGKLAMIFQEPGTSLNPVLTVGTQLGEVLRLHRGLSGTAATHEAVQLLDAVGINEPAQRLHDYPFQLSGGMKQRVMIAMALAGQPSLLIADEPTTALDVTIQAQVLKLLAELQRSRGMGMLLITHDLGVVKQVADRVGVMYAGELVEIADRAQFFSAPAHPYSRKLFAALPEGRRDAGRLATIPGSVPPLTTAFKGCRFTERCPARHARCTEVAPAWHAAPSGQQVRCHLYDPAVTAPVAAHSDDSPATTPEVRAPAESDTPLLEVRELRVHFPIRRGLLQRTAGYVKAVDGISFSLRAGRTLALVGESGCGKTTTGKALLNLTQASSGEILFGGQRLDPHRKEGWQAVRSDMQMVFQDPFGSLNPRMRVADIVEEGLLALGLESDKGKRRARAEAIMLQVGLRADMLDRYPHEFSGGQRQRIAIARALAVNPKLIVCDEPTSALDVSVQAQVLNLMRDLQQSLGLAYLFITHNIGVVEYLADDIAVMYQGKIVEYGAAQDVLRRPQHDYTRTLLAAVPRLQSLAAEQQ